MAHEPLTDDDPMPWGQHRGKKMRDVPSAYLLWLFEQPWIKDWPSLYGYLKANEKALLLDQPDDDDDDEGGFKSYQDYKDYRGF